MKRGLANIAAHLTNLLKHLLRACQQQPDPLAAFLANTGMTLDPVPA